MKRVAFIMFSNLSMGAGTENSVVQYCANAPEDWDITIVQTDNPAGIRSYTKSDFGGKNVRIVTHPGYDQKFTFLSKNRAGTILLLFFIWPLLFSVLKYTKYRKLWESIGKPDIVYLFGNYWSSLFPKGPIVIGSTHGWNPERSGNLKSLLTKLVGQGLMWKRVDMFHVFRHFQWFLRAYGVRGIPLDSGVDIRIFYPTKNKRPNKVTNFIFHGRLEECKGIMRVKEAMDIVVKRNTAVLSVAGRGPMSKYLENVDHIVYLGFQHETKLAQLLRQSDCYVYPTSCDSFSLVVLEALASGLYVITSNYLRGVYDEFEKIGLLEYCSLEPSEIAQRMENFITREVNHNKSSDVSELIEKRYSWGSIAKSLFSWFDEISVNGSLRRSFRNKL